MGATTAVKNAMLDAVTVTQMSLHSADPGVTGANEISGGSPAYARKAVTLAAAANGARSVASMPVFDVPGGVTVSHWALWNGSTFLWGGPLKTAGGASTSETWTNQGTFTPTAVSVTLDTPD